MSKQNIAPTKRTQVIQTVYSPKSETDRGIRVHSTLHLNKDKAVIFNQVPFAIHGIVVQGQF